MILESTGILTASVPPQGLPFTVGPNGAVDLWPQGAQHISGGTIAPFKGKPPLMGDGEQLYVHFRIESAFVIGGGSPICQFIIAQSLTADGTAGNDTIILGTATGPLQGNLMLGFSALTAATIGQTVEVPIGAPSVLNNVTSNANFSLFRYLLVAIYVPNFAAGANWYSSGSISAKISLASPQRDARTRIYPAAFNIQ
jgi:hypothetical protein